MSWRIAIALTTVTVVVLGTLVPAAADHPAPIRIEGRGPVTTAFVTAGVILLIMASVVVIIVVLTSDKPSRPWG